MPDSIFDIIVQQRAFQTRNSATANVEAGCVRDTQFWLLMPPEEVLEDGGTGTVIATDRHKVPSGICLGRLVNPVQSWHDYQFNVTVTGSLGVLLVTVSQLVSGDRQNLLGNFFQSWRNNQSELANSNVATVDLTLTNSSLSQREVVEGQRLVVCCGSASKHVSTRAVSVNE